jgi:hypothetical protein
MARRARPGRPTSNLPRHLQVIAGGGRPASSRRQDLSDEDDVEQLSLFDGAAPPESAKRWGER